MAKKGGGEEVSREELLQRWRMIEEQDDDDEDDGPHSIRLLKEAWFLDTFNLLIYLPKDNHIWCGSWDLMGPLLETFFHYSNDGRHDSPLKLLWKRISQEMRQCTQCICQHHQAQDMYAAEYELSSVGPLLCVLQGLDEERVTYHLQEINSRVNKGHYDPVRDQPEVVSVMFEVLMFPNLLDDQSLFTEFQIFIEAIDNSNELTLDGQQQYPGVYALFFFKSRRTRTIGLRLAGNMGKLRRATDLDPLQPMLKRCIGFLDGELLPPVVETSRPRVQLERITVWLGIKTLLGFLEPPAFEEGILENYPVFLSIVLNHISDDSLEFSYAVNCLRLLFEMLGCKLWLRASLSPSVMRNTLLGQCFHTRNEKIHKEIFDLFQPFLQSLEALQDGEHEKQRRHFIYFLLHQVTVSSNFSVLMKKKACQIALLIIQRGYKMVPPCPPFECSHMWGPSLVSSLKDSSLHNSLRQPAFDLIQTIIVSDAAALVTSVLNNKPSCLKNSRTLKFTCEDEDENYLFANEVEKISGSCWKQFNVQSELTSREIGEWMCSPMLWLDVLVEIDPTMLPVTFSKAVFWALSRFSVVEPESNTEMVFPVRNWLSTCASEISHLFGWKVPSGSDDGVEGQESKNSIKISMMCNLLVKTFKRLTGYFVVKLEQGNLHKQWTWEPAMSESLILLLVDPNDNARQVGRCILEQVSSTRGLVCGLQFLCSSPSSLRAVLSGLRHATKLAQMDSVFLHFQTLHHFFFVLFKLLKEGVTFTGNTFDDRNKSKLSSQGGFLQQPVFDSIPVTVDMHSETVNLSYWEEFRCLVAIIVWPFTLKCLAEGKTSIDYTVSQMTCVRVLEILPVLFERLHSLSNNISAKSRIKSENVSDYKWLYDLMDWGRSSLVVVARYWKQTIVSLLGMLKKNCDENSALVIRTIEELLSRDNVAVDDELTEQVSRLSVALSDRGSYFVKYSNVKPDSLGFEDLVPGKKVLAQDAKPLSFKDADVQILEPVVSKSRDTIILLSDDEEQAEAPTAEAPLVNEKRTECLLNNKAGASVSVQSHVGITNISTIEDPIQVDAQKQSSQSPKDRTSSVYAVNAKVVGSGITNKKSSVNESLPLKSTSNFQISSSVPASYISKGMYSEKTDTVIDDLARDTEDDPFELAVKAAKHQQSHAIKPNISGPKRQAIKLDLPKENRPGGLHKLEGGMKRLKPPRLDDWYRPILELDYFAVVGLASRGELESQVVSKLKEVPLSFESPGQYVDIFRPLVLEEFKAQMCSSYQEMSSLEDIGCGCLSVLAIERIDDFHIVRCIHDDGDSSGDKSISENDLILLTRQPLQNSSHDIHLIGKVEKREKDYRRKTSLLIIKVYLQNASARLNRARKLLIERSKWYLSRIMSITSQLREFQALSSTSDIPLLPIILNPINQPFGRSLAKKGDISVLPQPMQCIFRASYNDSQLQAIGTAVGFLDSSKGSSMSLIQGPPGTGKTRTILAIVSGLLAFSFQRTTDMKGPSRGILKPSNSLSSTSRPHISQSAAIARAWQDAALARQCNEDTDKNCKSMRNCARGRVLICAQSNAAVDELVSRISSEGLIGSDGTKYKPYIVRVGNAKTIHANSLPVFIDTLVDHQLEQERTVLDAKKDASAESSTTLRANLEKLVDQIRSYEAKRANFGDDYSDLNTSLEGKASEGEVSKEKSHWVVEAKLRKLYAEKKAVYRDLANAQAKEKKTYEERKALKHKLRRSILREAEVVVTTLSGCGGDLYGVCSESVSSLKFSNSSEHTLFDAVVIDEAAQALEPATLIPLQLLKTKGTRCIMVGDPKQLPATVLSNVASKYLYHCSMFERLYKAGHPVIMLKEQYRMHPEISCFPSLHFYDNELLNGEKMVSKTAPFHDTEGLGPYVFFDVIDGRELYGKNYGGMSLYNEHEADAAVEVLRVFKNMYPAEFIGGRIGVITPYKCQLSLLRSRFSSAFGSAVTAEMEFNTVDGFQGREVDILVLSTVRAAETCPSRSKMNSSNIGFVADVRRMNVALTRARLSLWILGNAKTLQTNRNWGALVNDAKKRNAIISLKRPYEHTFKSASKGPRAIAMSNNCSKQLNNDGEMKRSSNLAGPLKNNVESFQEKKKSVSSSGYHRDRKRARDGNNLLKSNEEYKFTQKTKHNHNPPKNDSPSAPIASGKERTLKCMPSEVKGDVLKDDRAMRRGSIDGKFDRKKSKSDKEKVDFVNPTSNAEIREDVLRDGRSIGIGSFDGKLVGKKSNLGKEKIDVENPTSKADHVGKKMKTVAGKSSLGNTQEFEGSDRCGTLDSVDGPKDAIMKRKKQREAVDALLSSALISSKKTGTSSKSLHDKRSVSSRPAAAHAVRPPNKKKGNIDKLKYQQHSRKESGQ